MKKKKLVRNAAWLSKLAYVEKFTKLKQQVRDLMGSVQVRMVVEGHVEVVLIENGDCCYVIFRGTNDWRDWVMDFNIGFEPFWGGHAHRGFVNAFRRIGKEVDIFVGKVDKPVVVAGHSAGGGLATLCGLDLINSDPERDVSVFTFGAPAVFNKKSGADYNQKLGGKTLRFVNNNDIVPRVPPHFKHVGHLVYFDRKGRVRKNPGWFARLSDRFWGRLKHRAFNIFSATDGLVDHSIEDYANNVGRFYA